MGRPSRANRPRPRIVVGMLLVAACAALSACGKQGTPPKQDSAGPAAPAEPDLSTPAATLAFATRALEAGDFEALRACSTTEGLERVRRDLLAWNALLADKTTGPRAVSPIPPPRDDAEKARYVAGLKGDPAGLLYMLARAEPLATSRPALGGEAPIALAEIATPAPGVERVEADRMLPGGTRRRVVLVLRDGAWRVDRIAL